MDPSADVLEGIGTDGDDFTLGQMAKFNADGAHVGPEVCNGVFGQTGWVVLKNLGILLFQPGRLDWTGCKSY
jgi:hypothetical protein